MKEKKKMKKSKEVMKLAICLQPPSSLIFPNIVLLPHHRKIHVVSRIKINNI